MKNNVLVLYSDNWADEFDVECFWLTDKETITKTIDLIKNCDNYQDDNELEIYFGTNECITIEPVRFLNTLKIREISYKTFLKIKKLLGEEFGVVSIRQIIDRILENEEN